MAAGESPHSEGVHKVTCQRFTLTPVPLARQEALTAAGSSEPYSRKELKACPSAFVTRTCAQLREAWVDAASWGDQELSKAHFPTTQPTSPKPPILWMVAPEVGRKGDSGQRFPKCAFVQAPQQSWRMQRGEREVPAPRGPVRAEWSQALLSSPAGWFHPSTQSTGRAVKTQQDGRVTSESSENPAPLNTNHPDLWTLPYSQSDQSLGRWRKCTLASTALRPSPSLRGPSEGDPGYS